MNLEGKCQAIHGHSMKVTIYLSGDLDENGILEGLDFGTIKKEFRQFIDDRFDHHLVLNVEDPAVELLEGIVPGVTTVPGDPTTENLAMWIYNSCESAYLWGDYLEGVEIQETGTNGASYAKEL